MLCAVLIVAFAGCRSGSIGGGTSIFASSARHDVEQGQQLLAQGDLDSARRHFECAERCDRSNAAAQAGLGQIAEKQEQWGEAVAHYRTALKLAPDNSGYASALANCLRRYAATSLERSTLLESAVRAYRHALTLAPNDFAAAMGLAQCYRQRGDFDAAAEALRHAQRIDPSNPQVHTMLAAIYEALQRYDAAMGEYKLALKLDREDPAVHNLLARLNLTMANQGRENGRLARERAKAHFRRSLQIDPHQPDVRQALAELQGGATAVSVVEKLQP